MSATRRTPESDRGAPDSKGARFACVLCDGDRFEPDDYLARIAGLEGEGVVRCLGCGLARRVDIAGSKACSPEYFESLSRHFPPSEDLENGLCRSRLERFAPFKQSGRLLEIGPGAGRFLSLAAESGWQASAVEADTENAKALRDRGVRVSEGSFDASVPKDIQAEAPFDVVYASHVLEHVVHPLTFLENAARVLRDGGLALIEVPNEGASTVAALRSALGFDPPGRPPMPSEHNYFFRPSTLRRMLARCGFSPIELTTRETARTLFAQPRWMRAYRRIDGWLGRGSRIEAAGRIHRDDAPAGELVDGA